MQEVAVSKKLMVVFGSMTLEYSHLEKVTNVIPAQFEFEGSLPSAIFSLRTVYQKLRNENCALPLSYLIFSDANYKQPWLWTKFTLGWVSVMRHRTQFSSQIIVLMSGACFSI